MFATCLFCNAALGANESIEHFPVGTRLAYDGATGRLWVICRQCERWNLSPLESRWEAIEEAERAFTSTRMRMSTDNIGLARLRDGTELVRIGRPPQLEFAAWRYGDKFGKRRRKFLMYTGAIVGATPFALLGMSVGSSALYGAGMGLSVLSTAAMHYQLQRAKRIPVLTLRDQQQRLLHLTRANANAARIHAIGKGDDWRLELSHVSVQPARGIARALGFHEQAEELNETIQLSGTAADNALASMLPLVNVEGGGVKRIATAIDIINRAGSIGQVLRHAPDNLGQVRKHFELDLPGVHIARLPAPTRLALEMSLHEDAERRAMEGELHELEARWREADAIAKIADGLLLPAHIDEQLQILQDRAEDKSPDQ